MYAAGVWCSWATIVGGGLSYIVGMGLSPFCSLVTWAPLIAMESRSSRDAYYGTFGFPIMRILFDWPLTFIGYTLRETFGLRLFSPFATKFDGTIVQGSMPFPSDVKTLVEEYDVVAVVNMCDEYGGPTKEVRAMSEASKSKERINPSPFACGSMRSMGLSNSGFARSTRQCLYPPTSVVALNSYAKLKRTTNLEEFSFIVKVVLVVRRQCRWLIIS